MKMDEPETARLFDEGLPAARHLGLGDAGPNGPQLITPFRAAPLGFANMLTSGNMFAPSVSRRRNTDQRQRLERLAAHCGGQSGAGTPFAVLLPSNPARTHYEPANSYRV